MSLYKAAYESSHALIVGIDEYLHLPPLSTASRGALAVEQLLQSAYGFSTSKQIDSNATQEKIIDWFQTLKCGPDDRVIFFFSGRGWTRYAGPNRRLGYLMLHDSNPNDRYAGLKFNDIIDEASALPTKHVLLVIDACFDGLAIAPAPHTEASSEGMTVSADTLISKHLRYVITAGGEEVKDESTGPDGNYSVFTHFLLKGLQGGAVDQTGYLRGTGLARYLQRAISAHRVSGHKSQHGYLEDSQDGDFIFQLPRAARSPGCTVVDPEGRLDANQRHLLSNLQKTRKITILKEITIGQSGSAVYLVGAEPHPPHRFQEALYYCKIYRTERGEEKETHEMASHSGIGKYVPRLADYTPVLNGWMASLYSVAHNTPNSHALSKLLNDNVSAAKKTLMVLVDILREWNPKTPATGQDFAKPFELLRKPFQPHDAVERVVAPIEAYIGGLTHTHQHLQFMNYVLPNPLHYIANPEAWDHPGFRMIAVPYGHIHGDLHSNNIICLLRSKNAKPFPVFIDFDTYDSYNNLFYDFAYLEYDISRRLLPPNSYGMKGWLTVSDYLTRSIALDNSTLGYQQAPLIELLRPLRKGAALLAEIVPFDYDVAYWIARTSVGLAFARKRKLNTAERMLGMLMAAHSMHKVLDLFEIEDEPTHQPFWMRWQDEPMAV